MNRSKGVEDKFHRIYYHSDVQNETYWFGRHVCKCPLDLWVLQEIIHETQPELIVETGVFHGGSALYYAHLFDIMGSPRGKVVSIDVMYDDEFDYPNHPRIELLLGASSVDRSVVATVEKIAKGRRTMVILDSDHACDHVLQELRAYSRFVSTGCYLIVEDTNVNGYPVMPLHGPGPMEAVKSWQPSNNGFVVDKSREKFILSFHPGGFLKRVR